MLMYTKTFDGHTLNDSNYLTALLNPHASSSAEPVYLAQARADSAESGMWTVNVQTKVLSIWIRNYANRLALIRQLKQWFKRGTRGDLVATFTDESFDYLLPCRVISLIQDPEYPMHFTALLQTEKTAWRGATADVLDPALLEDTGGTINIDVAGSDETFLNISLTPDVGPASGYLYQNIYRLPNTPGIEHGLIPWCITLDTDALVTLGHMQADCDDLRIVDMYTGQELKRWIADPDTATTKVWVNLELKKGFSLTLLTAVADSGEITHLQFQKTANVKAQILQMPKTGIVYHGNEWFFYTNTDPNNFRLVIGQRGLFGTTIEAHASSSAFLYIQHPLMMKYGNASVSSPATDDDEYDDTKPLCNLSSSSNTEWVWTTSDKFYDPDHPNRTGGWVFSRKAAGPNSTVFHVKQDAESGEPAIGFKVASWLSGVTWKAENVNLNALLRRDAIITNVSMTGDKYKSNANWVALAALRRSPNNVTFVNLWAETAPTMINSWTAWTRNSVAVAAGTKYLQLIMSGGYKAAADAFAAFEALTCSVSFNSSNIPTGAFLGESNEAYQLSVTVSNDVTGDAMTLVYPMKLGKTFAVDGEEKTALYDGVNAHSAMTLNDEGRSQFVRLQGGVTNALSITSDDLGDLTADIFYYRRRL